MRLWAAIGLMCLGISVQAAVSLTEDMAVDLLRDSSTIATHPSWDACMADARGRAQADTRTSGTVVYTCQSERRRVVATYSAPPVDCAVSAWSGWTGGEWSACSNGTQTRSETRTRSIITQPANGGASCPALTETRTATQSCSVPPPPASVTGTFEAGPSSVTLSGTYARWPGYSAALAGPIGNISPSGSQYNDDPRLVNGSRGGVYTEGAFQLTISGDPGTTQTVKLWIGGWRSAGQLTAGDYTHTTPAQNTEWNGVYTLTFTGSLTVRWARASGQGNVTIQAVSLEQSGSSPTGSASLNWVPPTHNTDGTALTDLAGYRIVYGRSADVLSEVVQVGPNVTSRTLDNLAVGPWFFAVKAYNASGAESDLSNIASKTVVGE